MTYGVRFRFETYYTYTHLFAYLISNGRFQAFLSDHLHILPFEFVLYAVHKRSFTYYVNFTYM